VDRILSLWLGGGGWGRSLCKEEKPSVVVLDHAFVTYWMESFIRQLKTEGIPTIAFPHSSFMFTHTHVLENEKAGPLKQTSEEEFPWDCIVVESAMRVVLLSELGIATKRMYPLGCIRFTRWWLKRSPSEAERFLSQNMDPRPVVLYLASNPSVTVKEGVERLKEAMLKYKDRIRFIVKVHSRRDRVELFKSFADCGIEVVGNEISSPALINAAEYVLLTVTSVVIDALLKGKKIVYAQFTTENEPLFSRYEVFPSVRSSGELEEIFDRMSRREWASEPSSDAGRLYLKDCVHGGYPDEESLLQECLKIFSLAAKARSSADFSRWVAERSPGLLSGLSPVPVRT
jgi:hypothetical protein